MRTNWHFYGKNLLGVMKLTFSGYLIFSKIGRCEIVNWKCERYRGDNLVNGVRRKKKVRPPDFFLLLTGAPTRPSGRSQSSVPGLQSDKRRRVGAGGLRGERSVRPALRRHALLQLLGRLLGLARLPPNALRLRVRLPVVAVARHAAAGESRHEATVLLRIELFHGGGVGSNI